MVFLLTGDNHSLILNFIKGRSLKYPPEVVFRFNKHNLDIREIKDISYSTGIFSSKKLVVMKPSSAADVAFDEDFLKYIRDSQNIEFIIDASNLSKASKHYKMLKKFAQFYEFSLPRNLSNFKISDAFLIYGNKREAIRLISMSKSIDKDIFGIIGTMHNTLRRYISMKSNSKTWVTTHPFVKKKLKKIKFGESDVKRIYKDLFQLDVSCKSENKSKKDLLSDFVLYSTLTGQG